MSALPNLTRILINLTQGNSKIYATVTAPQARATGESFGPSQKMMIARRGSVAAPGDTVLDLSDRYVLGYFNRTANDELFRMFLVPCQLEVRRKVRTTDAVSGFATNNGEQLVAKIWCDVQTNGSAKDVDHINRSKYRIITGYPVQVSDLVGDYKVVSVSTELGVTVAEAE